MAATEEAGLLKNEPHYGALRASALRDNNGAFTRVTMESTLEPEGKALYTKDVDSQKVQTNRNILFAAAILTFLFAILQFVGGIIAYSLCLLVNSTSFLVIFARLLFLAFLLQSAGRPTSRLSNYRHHKAEIHLVVLMLLIAWLIMGGALLLAVTHVVGGDFGVTSRLSFLITSGLGVLFAIIIMGVMSSESSPFGDDGLPDSAAIAGAHANSVPPPTPQSGGVRERGLLLRRTLKHVPMQTHVLFTFWFAVQCVLALVAALLWWFLAPETRSLDLIFAFLFAPLTFVATAALVKDIVNILTEGILQGLDFSEITESLLSVEGVTAVRHLRIWALTMDRVSLSVMLNIERKANVEEILSNASKLLKTKYDVFEYKLDTERERGGPPPRRIGISDTPTSVI